MEMNGKSPSPEFWPMVRPGVYSARSRVLSIPSALACSPLNALTLTGTS